MTGARSDIVDDTRRLIERVPKSNMPKAVGFGISTPEQAAEVIRAGADAAIVGSVCVDLIARGEVERLERLVREMKEAIMKAKGSKSFHILLDNLNQAWKTDKRGSQKRQLRTSGVAAMSQL